MNRELGRLEDEQPDEADHAEATRWSEAYHQLITLTERILEQTQEYMESLPEDARQYVKRNNIAILEKELEGFHARNELWSDRVRELSQ